MSTKEFLSLINAARNGTKGVDSLLVGSSANFLPAGAHDVIISGVDISTLDDKGYVKITFADADGKTQSDSLFLMSQKQDELSYQFKRFVSAIMGSDRGSQSSLPTLDEVITQLGAGNLEVFNMFTGCKLRIHLKPGKGFTTMVTGNQGYVAVDQDGSILTEEFDNVKDAREAALAKGHKRAYLKTDKMECTDVEHNINALNFALAEAAKAAGKKNSFSKTGINSALKPMSPRV